VTSRRSEVLLAVLVLLSLVAVSLEADIWQRTRSFSGPFPVDPGRSGVLIQWLGGSRVEQLLFDIGGDTSIRPTASALTLRIGDREIDTPHTFHDEMKLANCNHWYFVTHAEPILIQ
jgi:hypothetical protein